MDSEKTEGVVDTTNNEGEGGQADTVSIPKADYDKLNQTLGSLKRELKDLKKPKEEVKETPQTKPEENPVLQKLEKMALRTAGITHQDDVDLVKATAKKWNVDIDEVLLDDDFKVKLERQQTARSNAEATTNVRGGNGNTQAKNTPEYWVAKGTPPTPADVPDLKTRATIIKQLMKNASTSGKTFYNS